MILHERIPMGYPVIFHPVEIIDGKPCYCVYHPDLPGCMSDGETPEEAVASLAEARELWIEVAREGGCVIPEPPYADAYYHFLGVVP
jgi:antitoxin HicB